MSIAQIREKIEYFRTHTFVRNTAILQAGNMFGNVFQAFAGIIMARILQPEAFGVYALSFSLAGFISIFLGVGAQDAVTTILGGAYARNDAREIRNALAFLAKITVIMSFVTLVGAALAPLVAYKLYGTTAIGWFAAVVICASIISTTAYSFSTIGSQVVGRIRQMTILGLSDQMLRTTLALSLVIAGLGVGGIVTGHFIGASLLSVASVFVWKRLQRDFPILPRIRDLLAHMREVSIRKYLRYSFWIAVDRNLSNLYNILPILLTGIYVSASEVTFFKLAFAYINLALGFLGPIGTMLNVEFPKMKVQGVERLSRNFTRVTLYAIGISTALTLGAALVAPIAFNIFYGPEFSQSVRYVYALIPYGALMGLGVGLGSILRAINKVHISIMMHVFNLVIGVPLGLLAIKHFGAWGTIGIVTAWYVIAHATIFLYTRRHLRTASAA
ncbi:MAG: oligosaccharide flippase family protein [Patescibacteria group bacterium]